MVAWVSFVCSTQNPRTAFPAFLLREWCKYTYLVFNEQQLTNTSTFTMTIILMVATVSPLFRDILPADIEDSIYLGVQNLRRFNVSVEEFRWHLGVLEHLELARRTRSGKADDH